MLRVEYIGDKNWETEFSDKEKEFFHDHLGTMMYVTGIGVLTEESVEEFAFRVNHLRLMPTKLTKEHLNFFRRYIPTKVNGNTTTRLHYLRQKYSQEIEQFNSSWVQSVEKQRWRKSLKTIK